MDTDDIRIAVKFRNHFGFVVELFRAVLKGFLRLLI